MKIFAEGEISAPNPGRGIVLGFLMLQALHKSVVLFQRKSAKDAKPNHQALIESLCSFEYLWTSEEPAKWLQQWQLRGADLWVQSILKRLWTENLPIVLHDYVAKADEVLYLQASGKRVVCLLWQERYQYRAILHKSDPYEFLLHDLEHLAKFCATSDTERQQTDLARGFLRLASSSLLQQEFLSESFIQGFAYLTSDMNTHPIHALKFLKAIILKEHKRLAGCESFCRLGVSDERRYRETIENVGKLLGLTEQAISVFALLNDAPVDSHEIKMLADHWSPFN